MGVYSEMDLDLHYGDAFSEEGSGAPACSDGDGFPAFAGAAPADTQEPQAVAQATTNRRPREDAAPPAPKDVEGQESEDARKKAHEESEAKRKAEFDARQAAKKAAEQEQLAKLETMSGEELLTASMKRVSTDTEKLTRRNMKECVAEHIQTMCIEDPAFARKVMHPRKSMIRCFQYISRKAWDYVQDELKANGIQPGTGQQGYGCDVPDDLCYQWGVDYFNDPDAKEDHEEEEEFVPKPYVGGTVSKGKSGKTSKGKTGDKKADADKEAVEKAPAKKSAEATGQLSLGDFVIPEERAG